MTKITVTTAPKNRIQLNSTAVRGVAYQVDVTALSNKTNAAYITANAAYTLTNAAFTYANVLSSSTNAWSNTVGFSANSYSGYMANSTNAFAAATYVKLSSPVSQLISSDIGISGNLTITGAVTYTNTQTLMIGDNIFVINADLPSSETPVQDAGFEVNRGNRNSNAALLWIESISKWGFTSNTYLPVTTYLVSNTELETIATSGNSWSNTVSVYANNYAGVMANSVNSWAVSTFGTLSNTIAAFDKANAMITVSNTAPLSPVAEDLWWSSDLGALFVYYIDEDSSQWVEISSGTGSQGQGTTFLTRTNLYANTSFLAAQQSENVTINGYKSYMLISVSSNVASWVRVYSDSASRTLDEDRVLQQDPGPGSGVLAEVVTTGNQTQKITPFEFCGNLDSPISSNVYIRTTNLSNSSAYIGINIAVVGLEL